MSKFLDETGVEHLSQQIKAYVDDAVAAVASAGSGPKLKAILLSPSTATYVLPANTPKKVLLVTANYPHDRNPSNVMITGATSITIDGMAYNITGMGGYLPFNVVMTIESSAQMTLSRSGNLFLFEVE